MFLDDKKHGYGRSLTHDINDESKIIETTEGYWQEDKLHGHACQIKKDRTIFEGIFVKGKRHGPGTLRNPDGSTIEGLWQNNELVEKW